MVLAVIGSLSLMVLPRLGLFGQESRLKAAARRFTAAVSLARSEAVSRSARLEMSLDKAERRVTVIEVQNRRRFQEPEDENSRLGRLESKLNTGLAASRPSQRETPVWTGRWPEGVELEETIIRGRGRVEEPLLFFWPNGRVSEAVIYLRAGDSRLTLHLEPLTGQVTARRGRIVYDWFQG